MNSSTELSPIKEQKKNSTINFSSVKCLYGNPIKDVCINKTCTHQHAVMCADEDCQCSLNHDTCFKSEIKNIIRAIESRALSFKKIESDINKIFETAIDKLSDIQEKILLNYSKLFEYKTYSTLESQFFESLKIGQCENITGEMIFEINSNLNKREELNKPIMQASKEFEKISSEFMIKISEFEKEIEKPLKFVDMFFKSKIVTSTKDKNTLVQFLPNNFTKTELLYRASENNYEGETFHKLCDNVQSLMIIIKTKNDKIIGGYTPLAFPSTNRIKIIDDYKKKSFLFSLTEGDKLMVTNPEYALMNYAVGSDYIFSFGHDLKVTNKANKNDKSFTSLSFSYASEKYPHKEFGWKKFTGSNSCFFGIDEWEVWKIIL